MIGLPVNDYSCLAQVAELVSDLLRQQDHVVVELAKQYATTADLMRWIRSLPQRDDTNDPSDGPRAERCAPPQRLRIPAPDPNCVERAALYLAVAELLDPKRLRQLATIEIPEGRHTFVVENGAPIPLDPTVPANALEAGMFHIEGRARELTPEEQVDWICALAEEPARQYRRGPARVRAACAAMHGALLGRPIPRRRLVDVAFTLTLAEREARLFGARGLAFHRAVMNALTANEASSATKSGAVRNRVELRVGHTKIRPAGWGTLGAVARATGRVGARIVGAGAEQALARIGISPALLSEVERELNREGLSLGPVAHPTQADRSVVGTLAALAG